MSLATREEIRASERITRVVVQAEGKHDSWTRSQCEWPRGYPPKIVAGITATGPRPRLRRQYKRYLSGVTTRGGGVVGADPTLASISHPGAPYGWCVGRSVRAQESAGLGGNVGLHSEDPRPPNDAGTLGVHKAPALGPCVEDEAPAPVANITHYVGDELKVILWRHLRSRSLALRFSPQTERLASDERDFRCGTFAAHRAVGGIA